MLKKESKKERERGRRKGKEERKEGKKKEEKDRFFERNLSFLLNLLPICPFPGPSRKLRNIFF